MKFVLLALCYFNKKLKSPQKKYPPNISVKSDVWWVNAIS